MSLTIAQFTFGLQLAGQERVVVDLAKAFQRRGHRSLVCTTMFGGQLVGELEETNIPFYCLNLRKSYDPRALVSVVRYLRDNDVDVVITHGVSGCLIPRLGAALSRNVAFIHVEHNIANSKKLYHIFLDNVLALFADRVVCVSHRVRESISRSQRMSAGKTVVIHNGLGTERFSAHATCLRREEGPRRVGVVGRLNEQKGHIYLLEAAVRIVASVQDVEFVFIGDGNLRPMLERKVDEYGLRSYCHFLGVRNDVGDLLQTLDVFVLPSLWEGLPISLLEAQYLGIPSVATKVGGVPEAVTDGYNGLLVPPKDPAALASAILRVLSDDALRRDLSAHAKEVFADKFTVETMADSYLRIIHSSLASKAA